MGNFNIEVKASGGHGCQREFKDGEYVYGCRRMSCPDCIAREFVEILQKHGHSVHRAVLTHWPGEPSQVQDNLLTGIRSGTFPK